MQRGGLQRGSRARALAAQVKAELTPETPSRVGVQFKQVPTALLVPRCVATDNLIFSLRCYFISLGLCFAPGAWRPRRMRGPVSACLRGARGPVACSVSQSIKERTSVCGWCVASGASTQGAAACGSSSCWGWWQSTRRKTRGASWTSRTWTRTCASAGETRVRFATQRSMALCQRLQHAGAWRAACPVGDGSLRISMGGHECQLLSQFFLKRTCSTVLHTRKR